MRSHVIDTFTLSSQPRNFGRHAAKSQPRTGHTRALTHSLTHSPTHSLTLTPRIHTSMCVKLTKRFTRGRVQRSRKWTPGGQLVCVPARSHRSLFSFYRHRKHRGEPGHTHGTHGRAHTSTWMTDHSSTQKNPPIQTFYRYHDRYSTGTHAGTVPVVIFSPMVSRTDSRHHSCDTGGPRHRRRQRTLECGPAGPAQQHGRPSVIRTNINTTQKSQFKVRQVSSC